MTLECNLAEHFTKGKYLTVHHLNTVYGNQMTQLMMNKHSKRLGIKQHIIKDTAIKKIQKKFTNGLCRFCRSRLNGHSLIKAINTCSTSSFVQIRNSFMISSLSPTGRSEPCVTQRNISYFLYN